MAVPSSPEARLFYRAAFLRIADSRALIAAGRTSGAVYMAGYGVECAFKALLIMAVPHDKRGEVVASFRGTAAHDFNWLRIQYLTRGGVQFPPIITRHLGVVGGWSTDLRYDSRVIPSQNAAAFLAAATAILEWVDGRL